MTPGGYTLLVNSCDAFADCWAPFFTLLSRYWPDRRPPILLNTERKDWQFPGVALTAARVGRNDERERTWSECLAAALAMVGTPLVLYAQDDYFIERPVDVERIESLAGLMLSRPDIGHVGLTHFGTHPPFLPSFDGRLWRIGRFAPYRISTQAALWRADVLRSYLKPWENGWMFEVYGTVRAWRRNELFLTVRRDQGGPAIAYQHTGIVKGRWSRFVPALFAAEGISVAFDARGFHDESIPAWRRRSEVLARIAGRPIDALRSLLSP
jgi:hypothetical protein